jgi:hypothetical protein
MEVLGTIQIIVFYTKTDGCNKAKMKLTFCVYDLVIVGWNHFLYDFKNHEIDTFSFW